jgi:hypothetical protein
MHSTPWTLYRDSFAVVMTRFPLLLSHNNVLSRATEPIGLEPSTTGSISQGHLQSDTGSSSHPLVIHPSRILHRGSIQKRRNGKQEPSLHNEKPSIGNLVRSIHVEGPQEENKTIQVDSSHLYDLPSRINTYKSPTKPRIKPPSEGTASRTDPLTPPKPVKEALVRFKLNTNHNKTTNHGSCRHNRSRSLLDNLRCGFLLVHLGQSLRMGTSHLVPRDYQSPERKRDRSNGCGFGDGRKCCWWK